jgi:hypothetical protein
MHVSYLLSALATTALAFPSIVKRDADSIVASISTISADVSTLNSTLNTYTLGNPQNSVTQVTIQTQTDDLGKAIQAGTNAAKASAVLDSNGSGKVASAVLNLQPKITSLLNNIEAKKPVFDQGVGGVSASPLVLESLKKQKQLSAEFGAAVAEKLTGPFAALAPTVNGQIQAAFDKAIAKYSS